MKVCYIHAGIHKTGSTSIQFFLAKNRKVLLKNGVHIPNAGCVVKHVAAHHNLAFELNQSPRYRPKFGSLDAVCSEIRNVDASKVVLSSEDLAFSVTNREVVRSLEGRLEKLGFEVVWVFYLRWLPAWIDSAYGQIVKSLRITDDLSSWYQSSGAKIELRLGLDPSAYLNVLEAQGSQLELRSFDLGKKIGLENDFLDTIGYGCDRDELEFTPRVNERASILQVEYCRMVAKYLKCNQLGARRPELEKFVNQAILPKFADSSSFVGMTNELAAEIVGTTSGVYEKVLKPFNLTSDQFFETKQFSTAEFQEGDFSQEELLRLYRNFALVTFKGS